MNIRVGSSLVLLLAALAVGCGDRNDVPDGPPDDAPVPQTTDSTESAGDPVARAGMGADAGEPESGSQSGPDTGTLPVREVVTVYKSPTCGCCTKWVAHMREAGFQVETRDVDNMAAVKVANGVRPRHQSCHTALVGDYVIEGHVPADLVHRLLEERPDIAGLAVPGMPMGTPGMEMPGGEKGAYDVIAFTENGDESVYASR